MCKLLLVLTLAVLGAEVKRHSNLRFLQGGQQFSLQPDTTSTPPQYVPATDSPQFDPTDLDEWWELRSEYPDAGFVRQTYEDAYDVDDASDIQWIVSSS
jgi:hypothetical protein